MILTWTHVPTIVAAIFMPLLLSISGSCQKIQYEIAANTDFSKYKTYKWQRVPNAMYPDQATDQILIRSVDKQLASKGFTKTDREPADLYVAYQFSITEDASLSSFSNDIQWQGGANSLPGFKGATTNGSELIRKGWIILELYDVTAQKYVWRANANKTLGDAKNPKKMEKNAEKAMAKVFDNFPRRAN